VTQLTFSFLFDKNLPEKPTRRDARGFGAHSNPTSKRRPTTDKKCAAVAVSRTGRRRGVAGRGESQMLQTDFSWAVFINTLSFSFSVLTAVGALYI
jgi:hypothetical protein